MYDFIRWDQYKIVFMLEKGISHLEVLKISQQLDEVINEVHNDDRIQKV